MTYYRFSSVYLSIYTSKTGVAAGKSPQKSVVRNRLFMLGAGGRLPASLLFARLTEKSCQRQELKTITTTWLASKI